MARADSHVLVRKSASPVAETVERLSQALGTRGIAVIARVDHAAGAAKAGMALRPTVLLIFGNPKIGTPLIQANPHAGLDLPMKILVWQDEQGQAWLGYVNPSRLSADHGLAGQDPIIKQMMNVLAAVVEEAAK